MKSFANDDGPGAVHLKIDLTLAHPDNHVEVELWFTSLVDFPESLLKGMWDYE